MEVLRDFEDADTISIDTLALEEELQEERASEIERLQKLGIRVSFLHSSFLYYRKPSKMGATCYDAWKTMVKFIGGSPNLWRDLGSALGIIHADLDYIKNATSEDPADVVLKMFTQNKQATLDKIVDTLTRMRRYDILKALEEPLINLAQLLEKMKDDSGYQSNGNSYSKKIITPPTAPIDLPPVLSKKYVMCKQDPERPYQPIMKPIKRVVKENSEGPILFLSYAVDGIATAYNIKHCAENWDDIPGIRVITLNEKRDEVFQNPEKFIREYFEKADYIVPIVTSGYLQEIRSSNPVHPSTEDNLDCKYVNFIYNLIINNYIHASGCMNTKVRSVLPQNSIHVLRDITMYPDLMPWTMEEKFNEHFKTFLKDYSK